MADVERWEWTEDDEQRLCSREHNQRGVSSYEAAWVMNRLRAALDEIEHLRTENERLRREVERAMKIAESLQR